MKPEFSHSDQSLRNLFMQIPDEKLPDDFNAELLTLIQRKQRMSQQKRWWLIWSSVSISSIGIVCMTIKVLQYLSIDLKPVFRTIFNIPEIPIQIWTPFFFSGSIALLLLFLDFRLRKIYFRKK